MTELFSDPFQNYFDVYEETVKMDLFLSSLPIEDRLVRHQAWRRIVEEPAAIDEFCDCLATLNTLRAFGIYTPPYSAAIDSYHDGSKQYVIQVGHVDDGIQYDELDFSDPIVLKDYKELGESLLNYFDHCEKTSQPHLTDIARVDQYLYGRNASMPDPKPILVDLELHTGNNDILYQLSMFYEDFLLPLEEKSGGKQIELKAQLQTLIHSINTAKP